MSEEKKVHWFDILSEKIEDMLANPKKVKFNTHKNRKTFTSDLLGIIKDHVQKNTVAKVTDAKALHDGLVITRPNPEGNKGFAIMTEELSSKGDDILKSVAAKKNAEIKKGSVHIW